MQENIKLLEWLLRDELGFFLAKCKLTREQVNQLSEQDMDDLIEAAEECIQDSL